MKFSNLTLRKSLTVLIASVLAILALAITGNTASAVQIPYDDIGNHDIKDPVFNTYTEVPNGIGNEADFVRIRKSTGDVSDNQGGARNAEYVNGLDSACNVGDQFDIRTYIHNGADDDYNDNGNGSSVAHDTTVRMVAPFGQKQNVHTFTSTINATDVSPVTDTARLFCTPGTEVELRLVPSSVKVYSGFYGYQNVSDDAVNGVLPIGSQVPGSGVVWGCWADRVIVAYIVEVVEVPEPEEPVHTCDVLTAALIGDRKYKFTTNATAENGAVVKNYTYNFGDDTEVTVDSTETSNMVEHEYDEEGEYKVTVVVGFNVTVGEETTMETATGEDCMTTLTFSDEKCETPGKEHLPKDHPDCKVEGVKKKKVLPNTGAGSIAGAFAGLTAAGTVGHHLIQRRRK